MSENTTNFIPPAVDYLDSRGRWFTDAELRARDERIIRAASWWWNDPPPFANDPWDVDYDAVIAAAEADQ